MKVWRLMLVAAFAAGCGGGSNNKTSHAQDNAARERAFQFNGGDTLQQRASYDLHCPPQSMEAQVLQRAGMFAMAVSAGVRGCGLQASYMRAPGTGWAWLLNGPVMQDPSQMQAPPPTGAPPGAPPPPPGAPPPPPGQ